jgi:hypothetical protein
VKGDPNSSLTIYPEGGANQDAVAYGTIISGFSPGRGGKELDEAMRQLISSIRDTNPGLRPTGNPVNMTVSGRAAKSVEMLGTSCCTGYSWLRLRILTACGLHLTGLRGVLRRDEGDFPAPNPLFHG